jgi:hypothetical protein
MAEVGRVEQVYQLTRVRGRKLHRFKVFYVGGSRPILLAKFQQELAAREFLSYLASTIPVLAEAPEHWRK